MGSKISRAVRPPASHVQEGSRLLEHLHLPKVVCQDACLPDSVDPDITSPPRIEPATSNPTTMDDTPNTEPAATFPAIPPPFSVETGVHFPDWPTMQESAQLQLETLSLPLPPAVDASKPPESRKCIVCCEVFDKSQQDANLIYPCRCDSAYCKGCLKDMFLIACTDQSRMPVRCCIQIQIHFALPYLTEAQAAEYRAKYDEWSTPNPFYCPVPSCSTFIPTRILHKAGNSNTEKGKQRVDSMVGTPTSSFVDCPKCHTGICTNCRGLAHRDTECKQLEFGVDTETAALLKSWGYKRCPKCGTGVRRMYGCNHMGCICGAQWCWVCFQNPQYCGGECYDQEEEEYYSEDEQQSIASAEDSIVGNTDGPATAGEAQRPAELPASPTTTVELPTPGNVSNPAEETTKPADSNLQPTPDPGPQDLDARGAHYWEGSGLDFGDEPAEEFRQAWDCEHNFEIVKITFAASTSSHSAPMECNRCWNQVHPEIEVSGSSPGQPRTLPRLVPGYARGPPQGRALGRAQGRPQGRVQGRGQGRGPGRVRARAAQGRGGRVVATSPLSQSLTETASAPGFASMQPDFEMASNNGDRVVDSYGNVITTSDFIFNPDPPRRASFDFVAKPTLNFDQPLPSPSPPKTKDDTPFSFAYECRDCNTVVCQACKEDLEGRERPLH